MQAQSVIFSSVVDEREEEDRRNEASAEEMNISQETRWEQTGNHL